jgi:hypothetical protein
MSNIINPILTFLLSLPPSIGGMLIFGYWMFVAWLIAMSLFGDWEDWR